MKTKLSRAETTLAEATRSEATRARTTRAGTTGVGEIKAPATLFAPPKKNITQRHC